MRVLTCNVRYSAAPDGENAWEHRKEFCLRVVRQQAADLICCQEMSGEQKEFFAAGLPEYEWFGMSDRAQTDNPVNSVFYRRERFRRVSAGGYWLSETPHIPGSRAWNSAALRVCNWLRLVDRPSGHEFRLVNTHLDHISQPAREHQMGMILEEAAVYTPDYPQILTGDLNCSAENPVIRSILTAGWTDTYQAVHDNFNPGNTFHAFHGPADENQAGKIDWIFTRGALRALDSALITTQEDGRYPSDHYFVLAEVGWS
jgi:endonuclease/exonuclease/phosphatase family metal-dependent hydrolase